MNFFKNDPCFSFVYGGASAISSDTPKTRIEKNGEIETVYCLENGLTVTNVLKKMEDFGAYEWVTYFENTGDKNTLSLTEIQDADILLPLPEREIRRATPWRPDPEKDTFVLNPIGSPADEKDFYTDFDEGGHSFRNFIFPEKPPKKYACIGGRSSNGCAPFFHIREEKNGYILAYGWTGQWNAEISRTRNAAHFRAGIEDVNFILYPGEKIRTGSVVVLPYSDLSIIEAQNLWRRFLNAHYSPYRGEIQKPLCLSFWGGTESKDILSRIDYAIGKHHIPFDMVWMDAGWCGPDTLASKNEYEGDWWARVGDWDVSPHIHPNALKDVSQKIKSYGKKYILWFEPERTRETTHLFKEHPEYLIHDEKQDFGTYLVNLGNPEALAFIKKKVYGIIASLELDWYRQDFNTNPLHIWRANDTADRRGMTEIKHIMGLYDFWDEMRERFPRIMIDNCASGGKRLDIEMLKRSVPLWRSDAQCPANPKPELTQAHSINFSLWIPYSATGTGRVYDSYAVRSAYSTGGMGTTYSYSSTEHFDEKPEYAAFLLKHAEEYVRIRPYFDGDIYPHTLGLIDESSWSAVEWHRAEMGDGMLQVFRRAHSPYESATFYLHGIDADASYRITDLDGGEWRVAGRDLIENGLSISIKERRTAKIYLYDKLKR